jgi:BirA family transcriptional regulator, biotin operon repressor / biotin---[acetyl-CoA-carboxylase] ligase
LSSDPAADRRVFGWRVARYGAIDSTNEEARRRVLAGDPGGVWIVAEAQTAGRGRRGRSWISPSGNLHASALLINPCAQARAAEVGFVSGVALARAARDVGAGARLKWPNDLLIDGAKCAGLLVEGLQLPDGRFACIVGVGVNCAEAPEGVGYPTAELRDRDGGRIDAERLFGRLAHRFAETLAEWDGGKNFASVRAAWLAHAGPVGERIRIQSAIARREGVFEGLDVDGRLLFRGDHGVEAVEAADLWVLPASDGLAASASPPPVAGESRI